MSLARPQAGWLTVVVCLSVVVLVIQVGLDGDHSPGTAIVTVLTGEDAGAVKPFGLVVSDESDSGTEAPARRRAPRSPRVVIVTVGVGPSYLAREKERLILQSCYALVNNMTHIIETRDLFTLANHLEHAKLANASNPSNLLGRYAERLHEWYGNHGWKWAWTKPLALLALILDPPPPPPGAKVSPDGVWFDWMLYLDTDVATQSLAPLWPIFSQLDAAAERTKTDRREYHLVITTGTPEGNRRTGGPTRNDVLLVRNSPESAAFLRAWAGHSDCECWVDQGAFYIELLRFAARARLASGKINPGQAKRGGSSCDGRFSPAEKKKAMSFLTDHKCFEGNTARKCTWTKPGPMLCSCAFGDCFSAGWTALGVDMITGWLPPPVLLISGWPLNSSKSMLSRFHDRAMARADLPHVCNAETLPTRLYSSANQPPARTTVSWMRLRNGSAGIMVDVRA